MYYGSIQTIITRLLWVSILILVCLLLKKSDWFIGSTGANIIENTKYYNYHHKFTIKSSSQNNFYNHVYDDNKYKSKLSLNSYSVNHRGKQSLLIKRLWLMAKLIIVVTMVISC